MEYNLWTNFKQILAGRGQIMDQIIFLDQQSKWKKYTKSGENPENNFKVAQIRWENGEGGEYFWPKNSFWKFQGPR